MRACPIALECSTSKAWQDCASEPIPPRFSSGHTSFSLENALCLAAAVLGSLVPNASPGGSEMCSSLKSFSGSNSECPGLKGDRFPSCDLVFVRCDDDVDP